MSVRPQIAFCNNAFEISFSNKNKVTVLLKGLVSADGLHVCNVVIKQMNKSPLSSLKYV